MIFLLQWVRTHPQVQSWSIISRTIIVVHTGLLIQILGIEEIRRVPCIVALLYVHFSKRHILDILRHFAIKGGDVTTASQVVGMVEELHLLVVVVRLEVAICRPCACYRPCLCCLQRTIITIEALTVYVVVIVLTIIRLVKRLVIVFNGL